MEKCKGKKHIAILVVLLLGICGGLLYIPNYLDTKVEIVSKQVCKGEIENLVKKELDTHLNKLIETFQKQNDQMMAKLKILEDEQSKQSPSIDSIKVDFNKWESWCNLRQKICLGEDYDQQLVKFREVFAENKDLLNMVDELLDQGNSSILTSNLRKFVKIYKIDNIKLEKISGYVLLLSIRRSET